MEAPEKPMGLLGGQADWRSIQGYENFYRELHKTHRYGMMIRQASSGPGAVDEAVWLKVEQLMKRGQEFGERHEWSTAELYFREAVIMAPACCESHEALGKSLVMMARYVEAETALSEALKLYRSCVKAQPVLEATAQVLLSQTLAGQGKWEHALVASRRAVELDPFSKTHKAALEKTLRLFRTLKSASEPFVPYVRSCSRNDEIFTRSTSSSVGSSMSNHEDA